MIPVAIMALLTVTRHLRAAEEDGRLELVRSAPVGRDAAGGRRARRRDRRDRRRRRR